MHQPNSAPLMLRSTYLEGAESSHGDRSYGYGRVLVINAVGLVSRQHGERRSEGKPPSGSLLADSCLFQMKGYANVRRILPEHDRLLSGKCGKRQCKSKCQRMFHGTKLMNAE